MPSEMVHATAVAAGCWLLPGPNGSFVFVLLPLTINRVCGENW